ncbi:MAG: hypothetical protein WB797_02155 [Nocardioides sp.]
MVAAVALLLLTTTTLVACGSGSSSSPSGTLATKVIDITINGSSIKPNGDRIPVSVGQRIEFDVTADAPGEIHVHSSPEQEFEYDKGSSTLEVKPITAPGIITVESHTLNKVILQLEAK